jgi:zinc transport system substrate-binding protein
MVRRLLGSLLIVALGAAGAACSSENGDSGSDGRVSVVTAFYPLEEAASKVGGDAVDVQNLTPPGVEPHDLELTPQAIAEIQEADVVLYLGGGFTPAIEEATEDASGAVADLLDGLALRPGVPEEGEEASAVDPHVWLNPVLYRQVVDRVATALTSASPDDTATFESNADAFDEEIGTLDDEYRSGLTGCERNLIVTAHAAFGYLAEEYGLTQEPISGISPDAEPSAGRLAALAELVRREGVTTIFTEALVSPEVAETLAAETGATTAVLNPIEGLSEEQLAAGVDYVSVMRSNLTALREALGCP